MSCCLLRSLLSRPTNVNSTISWVAQCREPCVLCSRLTCLAHPAVVVLRLQAAAATPAGRGRTVAPPRPTWGTIRPAGWTRAHLAASITAPPAGWTTSAALCGGAGMTLQVHVDVHAHANTVQGRKEGELVPWMPVMFCRLPPFLAGGQSLCSWLQTASLQTASLGTSAAQPGSLPLPILTGELPASAPACFSLWTGIVSPAKSQGPCCSAPSVPRRAGQMHANLLCS